MSDKWVAIAWVGLSSALCVAGQIIAKVGLARVPGPWWRALFSPLVVGAGVLLVGGTLIWLVALSRLEFSVAMPIACLLTLVLSVVAGRTYFGETISLVRAIGIAFAMTAVWLITIPSGGPKP